MGCLGFLDPCISLVHDITNDIHAYKQWQQSGMYVCVDCCHCCQQQRCMNAICIWHAVVHTVANHIEAIYADSSNGLGKAGQQ